MNFRPLEDFLDSYLPLMGVPGSDTVVYRNHEEIFRHTAGYDDVAFRTPMRDNAFYNMYSISKPVLATAAMQLVERGEIMLDDPLYVYFPEFRHMLVKHTLSGGNVELKEAEKPILIRHLLSMTSGLDYNTKTPAILAVKEATDGRCPTVDIVRAIADSPLNFEPGESFKYGLGHDVMAGVIEVVSGCKFSDYMRDNIFAPLGMYNTGYARTPDVMDKVAKQYSLSREGEVAVADKNANFSVFGTEYECGGAGIISTVDDMILFADALACRGVGKSGERILSSFAVDLMRTNVLEGRSLAQFRELGAHVKGYGYGLGVRTNLSPAEAGNLATLGEFGWDGALSSYISSDVKTGISVFHAEHIAGGRISVIHPRLRNLIYSCIGE